jgi:hypothetical protein
MKKSTFKLPPIARLQQLLHYNPLAGELSCLVARGNRAAGALAGSVHRGRRWVMVDGEFHCAMRLAWALYSGCDLPAASPYVAPIDGDPLNLRSSNLTLSPYPHVAPLPASSPAPRGRRAQRPAWHAQVKWSQRAGVWKAYHSKRLLGCYETKEQALNAKREAMNNG